MILFLSGFTQKEVKLKDFFKKSQSLEVWEAMQEKRRLHNIEIIRQSIQNNLKKDGHDFSYEDILRCASEACWTPKHETRILVNESLKQLGLTKEDFS